MLTKRGKAAITAIAAALAIPAMLLGSGTAQATAFDGNPEVRYDPHPGGITAHIQSWSDPANCSYTADWVTRHFHLPNYGNSVDLEFPGVPLFRGWNVNVVCDNGKSTGFTYWY
jgi:hypothetical protein